METNGILFMTCHLLGMLSACANPSIYGFRNKHVRNGMYRKFDFNKDKIWIKVKNALRYLDILPLTVNIFLQRRFTYAKEFFRSALLVSAALDGVIGLMTKI